MVLVGSAEIVVTAATAGFKQQIKQAFRDARPEAEKEGERYGKAFGNKFRIQLKSDIRKAFRENRDWIKAEGERQGKLFSAEFTKSFAKEFQARLPDAFERALGNPDKIGDEYGKKFADAMKRGAKRGGTIALADVVSPAAAPAPAQAAGRGGGAPARAEAQEAMGAGERLRAAERAYAKLQALVDEHARAVQDAEQRATDAIDEIQQSSLVREFTYLDRKEAADNDKLSAHLAQVLKAAETEEDVARRLADFAADNQQRAQADLDATTAKMRAAAAEVRAAQLQKGGAQAGKQQLQEAEKRYNELRDLYDKAAVEETRAQREQKEREQEYLLALEKVKDRGIDLEDARRKKKSTAVAQAAIEDAKKEAEGARRAFEASEKWSKATAENAIKEAERTSEALQRLREADKPVGGRLSGFTIGAAEKEHARLQQLAKQAESDRDDANDRRFADMRALTEAEYELARRRDELIDASGRQVAKARHDRDLAALAVAEARARAAASAGEADVTRVQHQRIVIDVDRSAARIDLYKDGRRSALSFFQGFSREFEQKALNVRKQFQTLSAMGMLIGPAIATAVGAIASLGSGLVSLASVAGQAAGSLVVLPGIIGALGQAAVTAMVAMKGVGEAIGAGFKSADAAAADSGGATLAQTRAIADARKALSRAYEDSARRVRDANRDVVEAEDDLAEAQNEARIAQNALTGARRRAMETLEDLQFALEGAVLSEEEAVLRLQRATEALAEVRANPSSTAQELQEASLNYREAELAVRMAQDALEDAELAQEEAAKAGVEGSAEVVAAQNDIIDANNNVADREEALSRAREDRTDTAIQNARAIADAQERLTEALEDQGSAAGGAKAAADAYQEALAKLSPGAREFVEYIVSIKDKFKELREAAGSELFGPLTDGVKNVVENFFPALKDALRITGGALGSFATSITDVLSSSDFITRFTTIAEDNTTTIERFGEIIASVINGISGVLVAAGPLIDRFTSFLTDKAEDFERFATSGEGIAKMAVFFKDAGDTAGKFGEIIGNVMGAFGDIFGAANASGQTMLDKLIGISEKFEDFTSSIAGKQQLRDYFEDAGANAGEVLGLIWDIIKAIGSLADAPGIGNAAKKLRSEWVPTLEKIGEAFIGAGESLADLLINVTDLIAAFTDTASMEVFLGVLSGIVEMITDIVDSGIGRFIVEIAGPLVALGHAIGIIAAAFGFFKLAVAGSIIVLEQALATIALTLIGLGAIAVEGAIAVGALIAASSAGQLFAIAITGMKAAISTLGTAMLTLLTNPVFIAVAAIGALAAAFFYFRGEAKKAEERNLAFADSLDEVTKSATTKTFDVFAENLDEGVTKSLERAGISTEEFFAAVAGGTDEYNAFYDSVKLATDDIADQEKILGALSSQNEAWKYTVDDAKDAVEGHGDALGVAADQAGIYNDAAYKAVGILKDEEYAASLAKDAVNKLNSEYDDLVDNFTILEEGALSEERTQIRVNEVLGRAQKELEGFSFSLKDGTKEGDKYQSFLLDGVEAIEAFAEAQLGHKVAAGDVKTALEDNITALVNSVASTDSARKAARDYIDTVIQTPDEIATTFKVLTDQQSVKTAMDLLDPLIQGQLAIIKPEMDFKSGEDVNRAVAALALATGAAHPIQLKPEVVEASINVVEKDLADLLTDENGNIRSVEMLTKAEQKTYLETSKQLDILANNPNNTNKPREAIYLTEAEQQTYNELSKKLEELTVDTDGDPRTVEYASEAAEAEYKTTQEQLHAMMYNPDGSVRKVPYNTNADTSTAANQLAALEQQKRTAQIRASFIYDPISKTQEKRLQELYSIVNPGLRQSLLEEYVRRGFLRKNGDGTYTVLAAEGGPVTGPGGPTADKVGPFMLSSGEFILSAKAVQQLGGTSVVDALHKSLKSGIRPPHLASGGIMPSRSGGTLSLLAEGGKSERVEPLDANGLSAADRAILAALQRLENNGMMVNIGTIQAPTPVAAAKEVVSAMRAETYRMGMFS